jgi:hypothetical protein
MFVCDGNMGYMSAAIFPRPPRQRFLKLWWCGSSADLCYYMTSKQGIFKMAEEPLKSLRSKSGSFWVIFLIEVLSVANDSVRSEWEIAQACVSELMSHFKEEPVEFKNEEWMRKLGLAKPRILKQRYRRYSVDYRYTHGIRSENWLVMIVFLKVLSYPVPCGFILCDLCMLILSSKTSDIRPVGNFVTEWDSSYS